MSQYLKQWRLSILAALIGLATATPSQSFAQGQPGESSSYANEKVSQAGDLRSNGTLAEARNGGNQLDVWKSNTKTTDSTGQIWMSSNHGVPFQVGNTQTQASPAAAPFGDNGFFVVHTGIDGRIYWTVVAGNGQNTGQWFAIPNQTTPSTMSVSVANLGEGSPDEFVVFRGSGNDTAVYSTWLNDAGNWSNGVRIPNAFSTTGPAVCLNNTAKSLWVAFIGTDNQINTLSQQVGAHSWSGPTPRGVSTNSDLNFNVAPSCAATANGNVVVSYVDECNGNPHNPHYAVFNNGGGLVTEWTKDITNWQTEDSVRLTSSGNTVWSLFTGLGDNSGDHDNMNDTYWKTVYVVH